MLLTDRIDRLKKIIKKYYGFISQDDLCVLSNFNNRFNHPFFEQHQKLSSLEKARFDANREFDLIQDEEWVHLIRDIQALSSFPKWEVLKQEKQIVGKKKKQHELNQLSQFFENFKGQSVADFGGGVGNLSLHMSSEYQMKSDIYDGDEELIMLGKKKQQRLENQKINFIAKVIDENTVISKNYELGIGLHCCGSFGSNVVKLFSKGSFAYSLLFSCCYSKIQNATDYQLSSHSIDFELNRRALTSATLSNSKVQLPIYNFRLKILDYKYSLYFLLSKKHNHLEFFAMSNARRSLYDQNFYSFYLNTLKKFLPNLVPLDEKEVIDFYLSDECRKLVNYFNCYYAFSRYIGQAVESYIIADRALFLEEKGFEVNIVEAFDPEISPRNKGIIAKKAKSSAPKHE